MSTVSHRQGVVLSQEIGSSRWKGTFEQTSASLSCPSLSFLAHYSAAAVLSGQKKKWRSLLDSIFFLSVITLGFSNGAIGLFIFLSSLRDVWGCAAHTANQTPPTTLISPFFLSTPHTPHLHASQAVCWISDKLLATPPFSLRYQFLLIEPQPYLRSFFPQEHLGRHDQGHQGLLAKSRKVEEAAANLSLPNNPKKKQSLSLWLKFFYFFISKDDEKCRFGAKGKELRGKCRSMTHRQCKSRGSWKYIWWKKYIWTVRIG